MEAVRFCSGQMLYINWTCALHLLCKAKEMAICEVMGVPPLHHIPVISHASIGQVLPNTCQMPGSALGTEVQTQIWHGPWPHGAHRWVTQQPPSRRPWWRVLEEGTTSVWWHKKRQVTLPAKDFWKRSCPRGSGHALKTEVEGQAWQVGDSMWGPSVRVKIVWYVQEIRMVDLLTYYQVLLT